MYLNIYNKISLIGWSITFAVALLHIIGYQISLDPFFCLKVIQTFAALEILHAIFKIIYSSIFFTCIQAVSRLLYTWLLFAISKQYYSNEWIYLLLIIAWSLADFSRAFYYLRRNKISGWMRYNFFFVLYPTGQLLEVIISLIILKEATHPLKWLLAPLIISYFYLGTGNFRYMLRNRKKYYQKIQF